jgi:hypothetical protein
MRKFLFFAFLIISTTASAQWTIINGKQRFAKGLGIPTLDTIHTEIPNDSSQMVLRPQDSTIWYRYKGKWLTFGGGSTIDTTNRFVNNVTSVNDSTIRVYKGATSTTITVRPTLPTYTPTIVPYANASGVLTGALADLKYTSNTLYIGSTGAIGTQHALDLNNGRATIYGNFNGMRLNVGSGTTGVVDPSKSFSFYNKGTRYAYITTVGSGTLGQDPPFTHKFILDSANLYVPRFGGTSDSMAIFEATTGKIKAMAIPSAGTQDLQSVLNVGEYANDKNIYLRDALGNNIDITTPYGISYYTSPFNGNRMYVDQLEIQKSSNSRQVNLTTELLKWTNTSNGNQVSLYPSATFSNQKDTLPTTSGVLAISVNGVKANTSGNIVLTTGSGTVTSVATGYGLSGGTITTSGTLLVDSATLSTKYLRIVDTTNKWVNSVSQPNDSTIRVIKGGTTSDYIIRASVAGIATRLITQVYNNSGATIAKGSIVYINGAHSSNLPTILKAQANTEATSAYTYGLVETDIANNSSGTVIQNGAITNLNLPTSSYTDGQTLYLSPTVAGGYTTTKPLAPYHYVAIGTVTRAHPNFGTIQIAVRNGFQLDEMSDVSIALTPADSTLLQFSRVDSLWHDVSVVNAIGNKYIKPSDTSVFQRKSLSAYTVMANNTAATANATAITYRDNAEAAYTGSITWSSGTAPSGTTNHRYKWSQIGKTVTLSIMLNYGTAGVGNTGVVMALPSDCPAPLNWNGWATSSDMISTAWGFIGANTATPTTGRAILANNASNTGYNITISSSSTASRTAGFTLTYFTP